MMRLPSRIPISACIGLFVLLMLPTPFAPAHGFEMTIQQLDDEEPGVRVAETTYSVGRLKLLLALRTAPYRQTEFLFFGANDLLETAREAPAYTRLAKTAREEGVALTKEQEEQVMEGARAYARRLVYRDYILKAIPDPTMEQLRAIYDATKDEMFRTREKLILREIFLPFGPTEDEAKAAIERAWEKLEGGAKFIDVMAETMGEAGGTSARIVIPEDVDDDTPLEVVTAFRELKNREYSRPVRSARGYHLIYRQLHIEGSYIPFESTMDVLINQFRLDLRRKRNHEVMRELSNMPGAIVVRRENLQNQGDLALDSDIMLVVEGRPVTRGQLIEAGGWTMTKEARHTAEELTEAALDYGPVQRALVDAIVDRENVMEAPVVQFYKRVAEETLLARAFLQRKIKNETIEIGDREILEYHWRMLEASSSRAPSGEDRDIVFDRITIETTPEEIDAKIESFREDFAAVTDIEEFRKTARELSSREPSALWFQGVRRSYGEAPEVIREAVNDSCVPGLTGIAKEGDMEIVIHWIISAPPPPAIDIAEIGASRVEEIRQILIEDRRQNEIESMIVEMAKTTEIEPLFQPGM